MAEIPRITARDIASVLYGLQPQARPVPDEFAAAFARQINRILDAKQHGRRCPIAGPWPHLSDLDADERSRFRTCLSAAA